MEVIEIENLFQTMLWLLKIEFTKTDSDCCDGWRDRSRLPLSYPDTQEFGPHGDSLKSCDSSYDGNPNDS